MNLCQVTRENVAPIPIASKPIFGFFGLHENPFGITPNPRFLYLTPLAQTALQQLLHGILNRQGLILLTGEVGTGKTLLLRHLLEWLDEHKMSTALILNSRIKPHDLLDFILSDFEVPCNSPLKSDKLISLNHWLLDRHRYGQTPVLIVDEAQGLPLRTLEEIRLLLNLETSREKLLQIIVAGQPEFEEKLKRHELRQFRQRITVRCRTAPLALPETLAYIHERLRIAGAKQLIFQRRAAISIHAYSRGIPRVVNLLCEHALINACADGSRVVTPECVECAARDCQLDHVDPVNCITNSSDAAAAALCDISSILGGTSLPDSAPPNSADSPGSPVFARASLTAIDSAGQIRGTPPASSDEAAAAPQAWSPMLLQGSDLGANPVAMLRTENPPVDPSTLLKPDAPQPERASSANTVHTRASAPATRVLTLQMWGEFSRATVSLLQGWRRSFLADAHSTWGQLRRLVRAQFPKVRPYVRKSVHAQN
jgi:general secretion pathway protein A